MALKHGLGRGLGALLKDNTAQGKPAEPDNKIIKVSVERIENSPFQPRRIFDQESINELTESIRERGIIQPLLVRVKGSRYELIAGERRLIAAKSAELKEVPVIIMKATDNEALELALIENLQREDLNVMEEAEGYKVLADKFSLTQEQIAERVGKSRASITNTMRLLGLPNEVKSFINDGKLSSGHAKILAGLEIKEEILIFARRAVKENLSVHNFDKIIQKFRHGPRKPRAQRPDMPANYISHLSDRLHKYFGTNVRITPSRTYANGKKAKGVIEIDYYSNEDLDRILELLGVSVE